jgi:hypothetical protein
MALGHVAKICVGRHAGIAPDHYFQILYIYIYIYILYLNISKKKSLNG